MAQLRDFLQPVYVLTNRPDLERETSAALSRALRKAHNSGYYSFDVARTSISNPSVADFSFPLPERFRAVRTINGLNFFVRKVESDFNVRADVQASDETRYNNYYIAGQDLVLHVCSPYSALDFQYFRHPTFEDSYIAINMPELIHYYAAEIVLTMIKDPQAAQRWQMLAQEQVVELTRYAYQF